MGPASYCSCRKQGGTPGLESSLQLSCKAQRLVFGVGTPILKSAIIRATNYEMRMKARLEVGFQYLSEVDPDGGSRGDELEPDRARRPSIESRLAALHLMTSDYLRVCVGIKATSGYHGMELGDVVEGEVRGSMTRGHGRSWDLLAFVQVLDFGAENQVILITVGDILLVVKTIIAEMSSEGTLSVGGGEGMRDVSSSSSSSSSRGSGGRTSVSGGYGGQEGGLVPTNILEVGDNREKCYDESDEVVGEVVGYKSCWRCRGELGHLVENYSIPPYVLIRPVGAGLRFPILELLVALLKEYGLGLTQLVPNGVRRSIVGDNLVWDSISAYDRTENEVFNRSRGSELRHDSHIHPYAPHEVRTRAHKELNNEEGGASMTSYTGYHRSRYTEMLSFAIASLLICQLGRSHPGDKL
ncbi:hypothetical protein SLEP1_g10694 [Rubroshorea leprosula]|uniref:Uncharacterized protein n=1 Tax=Rubroshorea leprosula TaxID=152421 RepID=A0AAV5IDC8_9ROSI|nr:hypothetical protein SLEP1_g10694 [Rubroshorea leprosula]